MTAASIALPEDIGLRIAELSGIERLGEIATYELVLSGPVSPIVLPSKLMQSPCVLTVDAPTGPKRFSGIVTRFVVTTTDHEGERIYRMTVRPRLSLLEYRRVPRIIRDRKAPDIAAELAREVGYDQIEMRLSGQYPSMSWTIQYDESDATFLRRLCEDFGFYFRTEERDGAEILIFEDTSANASAGANEPLSIVQRITSHDARPLVSPVKRAERRRPGKVTLQDYDPDRPKLALRASAENGKGIEKETEVFVAPGGFRTSSEGQERAKRRLEALRADGQTMVFTTNVLSLSPGQKADFADSERSKSRVSAEGAWFLIGTDIRFSADKNEIVSSARAIPLDTPFRLPLLTPKPRIEGIQSAIVTGASSEEIHCDSLGRVNVAFHWDLRGPKDGRSSIPIRVTQPQAPGSFVLPRVGWEVFVMFEEGDPERPLILGRSYNAKEVPPLPLPANKTISVLATDSSPGAPARTMLRMDDQAGREHLLISAPFGMDEKVYGDSRVETRKNENIGVQSNVTTSIGADQTISIELSWLAGYGSRSISVAALQKQTAGGSFFSDIGGTESVNVGGVLAEKVGNPVKGAANLAFSAVLSGIASRGTAGAIVAAGAGIGKVAYEGYEKGGADGAAQAAKMGLAGVAASMIPGGDAIIASVTGSAKPMPWDQGKPPEGAAAEGGGASAAGGTSGAQGPGPGHRATIIDGSYTEFIGGAYTTMTPGAISWVTVGPSTLLINASHTSEAVKGGFNVGGAMNETLGSLAIASSKNISRKITGVVTSNVAGARAMEAGGEYNVSAKSALKLSIGGSLSISSGTVELKCGASQIIAGSGATIIISPKIRITGSSSISGKLTHL